MSAIQKSAFRRLARRRLALHEVGDAEFRAFKIGILQIGAVEIGFLQCRVTDAEPSAFFALRSRPISHAFPALLSGWLDSTPLSIEGKREIRCVDEISTGMRQRIEPQHSP